MMMIVAGHSVQIMLDIVVRFIYDKVQSKQHKLDFCLWEFFFENYFFKA